MRFSVEKERRKVRHAPLIGEHSEELARELDDEAGEGE